MDSHRFGKEKAFRHGGNLDAARRLFGLDKDWVDLSTGINPVAYPIPVIEPVDWQRLPGETALDQLKEAAATCFGCSNPNQLLAAPGTQAILQLLPRLVESREVAIVGPTYNEHAACWRRSGAKVSDIADVDELPPTADVLVLVNPNNPDGRIYERAALMRLTDEMARRGGLLIVDEAFCDIRPDSSVAADAGRPGLIVLRSFGKFFGLAGVRLGFALGPAELLGRLADEFGPWAVSGPALEIGRKAYTDQTWIEQTRQRLQGDAARLGDLLDRSGFDLVGGCDLFVLAAHDRAEAWWSHLAEQGVWSRAFVYESSWLRFGLPGAEAEWRQLSTALKCWSG